MNSLIEFSVQAGAVMADMSADSVDDGRVVTSIVCLLHYADSLGLDALSLSRMAEMHYIDEKGEVEL